MATRTTARPARGSDEALLHDLLAALRAASDGDFTVRLRSRREGMAGEVIEAFNTLVTRNARFSRELERVRKAVGRDGRMNERFDSGDFGGSWSASADAVNGLVEDLARPTTEVGRVIVAVAEGDLTQKMAQTIDGQPVKGEFLRIGTAVNRMVDQLSSFADEVTRVAREVGTEGILGGQARVKGVSGTWKDLTDSVNSMASNLTTQVRNIAQVTTAVADGDLTQKITVEAKGEVATLAETINRMVDQLSSFADEVTRVAREVGTEGILGGQARVKGVSGTWADLTDSVNFMASNLTTQVRNIAQVSSAIARGDLTQRITVEAKGEVAALAETINSMTDTLRAFADEVTRVAREVGTDGILGGQAKVEGVSGTWKNLTDSVNVMASNLTTQVRNVAQVTTAVAKGDLSQKVAVEAKGEVAALAETINTMVDQLSSFADEVTRVAREVGTEGKLGGQAEPIAVSGVWKGLTDNVNSMASNLTAQVRDIAEVSTAIANGDLTRKITVDVRGEILELKQTINRMVDQLSSFAEQVTTVAREVGTEGRLGGQAEVTGVSGTWRALTDSVNTMASNLTAQVRDIAEVSTAIANGDLTRKITVDVRGEILELKNTINRMVDQLSSFADEVTRVAREVGTEGKLGGQAEVRGVSGTWKDLTDNVNFMASNLTTQVRNVAQVTTAVADGDLSQKVAVEAQGEVATLAETINRMVDQLSAFASEVTRVAREVGTEGKLGGQAEVPGVSGVWKGLTDNVNFMASNLTAQVRDVAEVTTAIANGDLTRKISVDVRGEMLELKNTMNVMVDQLSSFADEVTRVAREVGTEGRLGGQAQVRGVSGVWKDLTDNVNFMASNLTNQVRNVANVATAVARGDLTRKITVDVRGEMLELKDTLNTMVDQLSSFADEVTRVAREVGTEGKLGGQARVRGVSGTWKDLTDNVNSMADNLTGQVRNIAQVTTAVANGDLTQKITVDARGEILELKNTINTMVDQLSSFASEVTRVAREVGTEGQLGGQAQVEGVSGTWKRLTENVNIMAGSLTTQVRAIAEVSTAVAQGDLTRSVTVDAAGEVAELKDNVNQMIANLRETTRVNEEQDWLKTNLARISGLMQGQRDLQAVSRLIMSELTPVVSAQHGVFFLAEQPDGDETAELRLLSSYGYKARKNVANRFKVGESLVGQAALEKKTILLSQAPGDYIKVSSGLGETDPVNVVVLPLLFEDQVLGVVELASVSPFSEVHLQFLEQLIETIGVVLNTIIANMRTEELLEQSQRLAEELQERQEELQAQQEELRRSNAELESQAASLRASEELLQQQQEELQQTNEELQEKARLLEEQNRAIEVKNAEIEAARLDLEEQAAQLAVSSKYKSEFLANMSHELRTPLNSLLILAKLLSDNGEGNLTDRQVEFASTIHGAGAELLELINDILDLSKVEAGKMDVTPAELPVAALADAVRQSFQPVAEQSGLAWTVTVADDAPASVVTDEQRLQQILKNLLSNAFKFTEAGGVELRVGRLGEEVRFDGDTLTNADGVVVFDVVDTGIGIADDKLRLIFEAFQQADGTTSRRFGGTGLGLTISRDIARLLGGEIRVHSSVGQGSTFSLYLPVNYRPPMPSPEMASVPAASVGRTRTGSSVRAPATSTTSILTSAEPDSEQLLAVELDDDRDAINSGDRVLLVVEHDEDSARAAIRAARRGGFRVVVALRAGSGLALAREYKPDAIVLDADLPSTDGISLLGHLKRESGVRHIPVHVLGDPDARHAALRTGAVGFSERPASGPVAESAYGEVVSGISTFLDEARRRLLIVEDDAVERGAIAELVGGGGDVDIVAVGSSEEALEALEGEPFGCVVLDLKLPKMTGFTLLEKIKADERFRDLPVVIYTGRELTRREETRLRKYAETIIVKDATSPERLLDETALHLHRRPSALPAPQRRMIEQLHEADRVFQGKKILVVDDDVRNVFALTSALEARGMQVLFAENGRDGIEVLKENPGVDLILMDVMMPEMDGYQTTRAVRKIPQYRRLPIIALTAKAMKGDREKSIAAGASDYITKPVDIDQLVSLMRVWLYE